LAEAEKSLREVANALTKSFLFPYISSSQCLYIEQNIGISSYDVNPASDATIDALPSAHDIELTDCRN
jgi:hypothetical protein